MRCAQCVSTSVRLAWLVTLALPGLAAAQAPAARSTAADRSDVAVTIYNSNLALIREVRDVELPAGPVELAWEDVSTQIRAETVHVKALDAAAPLRIVEQNYRYDLLAPSTLIAKYLGRQVTLVHVVPGTGQVVRQAATLLSIGDATGVTYGGGYGSGGTYADPAQFVFDINGDITFGGGWRKIGRASCRERV
jgi:hypothetical protein